MRLGPSNSFPSVTPAQLAANRANSKLSTGPKTEAGKEVSSQNRRSYGFNGAFVLLDDEDECEYQEQFENLLKEHQPATETERLLVTKLAQHYWLIQRALSFQSGAFNHENFTSLERQLSLFMRYQGQHERAFNKTLAQLQQVQKERRAQTDSIQMSKLSSLALDPVIKSKRVEILELRAAELRAKAAKREASTTCEKIGFEPPTGSGHLKSATGGQPAAA